MTSVHPADLLANTMRRIYNAGLTSVSGGNISYLDDSGALWITPSGTDKAALTADQIVCLSPDGTLTGNYKPSVELPFHRLVYQLRPDVRMVIHAHPPLASAFAIARKEIDASLLPDAEKLCGSMALAAYDLPGSITLGEKVAAGFASGCNSVLLENHGLAVTGEHPETAFARLERLEALAHTLLLTQKLGSPSHHPPLCGSKPYKATLPAVSTDAAHEMLSILTQRAYRKKLFSMYNGTFSQRYADGFLIIGKGADRSAASPESMVFVREDCCETGKAPDESAALHAMIYAAHPHIRSVCTACPPSASAFLLTSCTFPPVMLSESHIVLRSVRSAASISELLSVLSENTPIALLQGNCVVTTAASAFTAFDRLEVLDMTALSSSLVPGKAFLLNEKEKRDIQDAFW